MTNSTNTNTQKRRVIVIGSGPAGYAAAIYLARAELNPLMFAGEKFGGQLMLTTEVENYPGFSKGIMGPELVNEMSEQAKRFGAEIINRNVVSVDFSKAQVEGYTAGAVVIATGAKARLLGIPGEEKFMGRGVSTCAVCDAAFYKGKEQVYVVGGGDAALEEVMALSKYANNVTLIHRRDTLRASKIMQRKIEALSNVIMMMNSVVVEVKGSDKAEKIVVKNVIDESMKEHVMNGLFISVGHIPATDIFKGQVDLDEKGYVKTKMIYKSGPELWLDGYPTMTSRKGVFAAGDVVDIRYKQAVTAAGMGVQAALDAEKYLTGSSGAY